MSDPTTSAITGDPSGNRVAKVMVSEHSRRSARPDHGLIDLEAELAKIEHRRTFLKNQLASIQSEIVTLNSRVTGGHRLPSSDYRRLVDRQSLLKKDAHATQAELSQLNIDRSRLLDAIETSKPRADKAKIWMLMLDELRAIRRLLEERR